MKLNNQGKKAMCQIGGKSGKSSFFFFSGITASGFSIGFLYSFADILENVNS